MKYFCGNDVQVGDVICYQADFLADKISGDYLVTHADLVSQKIFAKPIWRLKASEAYKLPFDKLVELMIYAECYILVSRET